MDMILLACLNQRGARELTNPQRLEMLLKISMHQLNKKNISKVNNNKSQALCQLGIFSQPSENIIDQWKIV